MSLVDRFDYFVFDFDGTLFDSHPIFEKIAGKVLAEHGVANFSRKPYESEIGGLSTIDYASWLIQKFSLKNTTKELLLQEFASMYHLLLAEVPFVSRALEFLQFLKSRGKKIGIATAGRKDDLEVVFERHTQLSDIVDCLVTCEMVGKSKPDCAVYSECLRRLGGCIQKAVVFEDSIPGLIGAKASGMYVVGIITDSQHYAEKISYCDQYYEDFGFADALM